MARIKMKMNTSETTLNKAFMRDVILVLPRDGLKIIIPVHRVFLDMIPRPFRLLGTIRDLLFGERALALLCLHHQGTIGQCVDQALELFFADPAVRFLIQRDQKCPGVHRHHEHILLHTADPGRPPHDRSILPECTGLIRRNVDLGNLLFNIIKGCFRKGEFDESADHSVLHFNTPYPNATSSAIITVKPTAMSSTPQSPSAPSTHSRSATAS